MAETKESFDNYYKEVNKDLYEGYNEKFYKYLEKEFGDKWKFHLKFFNESYYPETILGTYKNILGLKDKNFDDNYYVKDRYGSFGRNIKITKSPYNFFRNKQVNRYVIQKEIKSMINNKKKFDYRIYFLLLKRNNVIEYYYYDKYVIRNCADNYDEKSLDFFSNITNHHMYSLRKLDSNFYKLNEDFELDHSELIKEINFSVLKKMMEYKNDYVNIVKNGDFRILGIDYVVEKDTRKLYVLEINTKPGVYYPDVKEDYMIKYNNFHKKIVSDLNNILIDNRFYKNNWIKV